MGYQVYEHRAIPGRFAGYGVPATCDYPGCQTKIDRGFSYICGGDLYEACDRYFCVDHLICNNEDDEDCRFYCPRCYSQQIDDPEYPVKPEHPKWVDFVQTDESWAQYRQENPQWRSQWTAV